MLTEYPLAKMTLGKIDRRIEVLCAQHEISRAMDESQLVTASDLHTMANTIEENRAVMKHAVHECEDCLSYIQSSVKQAKAAFVW